ncbi:MAG TPA: hypothetical protein VKB76_00895, partial [Ktedonobacterales bacterium]|nr:hypothetical protein [Ktedonobacterales bacterium]
KHNAGISGIVAPERRLRRKRPSSIGRGPDCQPVELLQNGNRVLYAQMALRALIYANLFDDEGEEIIPRG